MSDDESTNNNNNNSNAQCLGTRRIAFQAGKGDGMLAIFRDDESKDRPRVVVTDGKLVCEQVLALQDVKMKLLDEFPDDQTKTQVLAGYLLGKSCDYGDNDDGGVIAEYYHGGDTHVDMQIRYCLKTSEEVMVKKAWKGRLEHKQQGHQTTCSAMLSFCTTLGDGVNKLQHNQSKLQTTIDDLRQGRQRWRKTAEELEGKWQTEKDYLLQNFLTLYNKVRAELGKAREELGTLRNRQGASPPQTAAAVAQHDDSDNEPSPQQEVDEGPDDHDENLYPEDLVDRLAAGPVSLGAERKRPRWDANLDDEDLYSKPAANKKKNSRMKTESRGDNTDSDATTDDPPRPPAASQKRSRSLDDSHGGGARPQKTNQNRLKQDDSDSDW